LLYFIIHRNRFPLHVIKHTFSKILFLNYEEYQKRFSPPVYIWLNEQDVNWVHVHNDIFIVFPNCFSSVVIIFVSSFARISNLSYTRLLPVYRSVSLLRLLLAEGCTLFEHWRSIALSLRFFGSLRNVVRHRRVRNGDRFQWRHSSLFSSSFVDVGVSRPWCVYRLVRKSDASRRSCPSACCDSAKTFRVYVGRFVSSSS